MKMNPETMTAEQLVDSMRADLAPKKSATELALEKGKEIRQEKTKGIVGWFKKAGEVMAKGADFAVGLTQSEVRDAYKQEVSDIVSKNYNELKTGIKHVGSEVGRFVNEAGNLAIDTINGAVDTMGRETKKFGKNLLNAVGTDVFVPVLVDRLKPVIKFIDDVETGLVKNGTDLMDSVAKPVINNSIDLWGNISGNTIVESLRWANERSKSKGESKKVFGRLLSWADNKVNETRSVLSETCLMGASLKQAASEIRAGSSARHQERVQTMGRIDQDAQRIKTQGLV